MNTYARQNSRMRALARVLCLVMLVAGFFGTSPAFAADVKMGGYTVEHTVSYMSLNRKVKGGLDHVSNSDFVGR